jgi:hypothetical protein
MGLALDTPHSTDSHPCGRLVEIPAVQMIRETDAKWLFRHRLAESLEKRFPVASLLCKSRRPAPRPRGSQKGHE